MKTKTIKASKPEEIDRLNNDFNEKNNVKFTQSHYNGAYVFVIFYED